MEANFKYPIGTQYSDKRTGKTYTVTDHLTLTNSSGVILKARYQVTHEFMGQTITDFDVNQTTIAMRLAGVR